MRVLLVAILPIGVLAAAAAPAHATCDGCCELEATLAGWSADGRSFAVIERHDGGDGGEALTLHTPGTTRSWSAYRDVEQAMCVEGLARLPGRAGRAARRIDVRTWKPLRRHQLAPVDATWREAFAAAIDIVAVGRRSFPTDPLKLGVSAGDECLAWELRDGAGRRLATLPRDCSGGGSTLLTLDIAGGYLHDGGDVALVKLEVRNVGLSSYQRFVLIDL